MHIHQKNQNEGERNMKKERFMDKNLIADIYERFLNRYSSETSIGLSKIEQEFLSTLSPKQKDQYFKLLFELFSYQKELDLKLISFTFAMDKLLMWQEQDLG